MPGASRLGDQSQAPSDSHGCKSCAHSVVGPAISGSPDVIVNNKPGLRLGDTGIHSACCGANTWQAVSGSMTVFINNRPAMRLGDATQHCGGPGTLIEGSTDVSIGDVPGEVLTANPVNPAAPPVCVKCLLLALKNGAPFSII